MSADSLHIETPVDISDLVTFHSEADSALMHIQSSGEMVLHPIGNTPLGDHTGLVFVVCIVASLLVGLTRLMSSSYISKTFSSIFISSRGRGSVYADLFIHYLGASAVMGVVYMLVDSIVIFESLVVFGIIERASFLVWLYCLGGILLYTVVKIQLHVAILSGFGLTQLKENLIKHKIMACHVEALELLPISIVIPFLGVYNAKMILVLSFVVVSLLLIWRFIRLFEDVSVDLLSFVNIIFYLCAVELAPFACIMKVLGVI
ncbi:MAG: DUF4271 domain-containing protein [Bacteroidales bacterium]|nr:DUF4271 domain-containing protein [Bacteroidales bacterium]